MRPFMVRMICLAGFLIGLSVVVGCGSQDVLDENGQRYTASLLSFSDAGATNTLTIDVTRDLDCDDDGNNTDPEPFTDVFANIAVTAPLDAPGITLDSYTIEFIPQESIDSAGITQLPPDLPDLTAPANVSIDIPSGVTATFSLPCMTFNQKADYVNKLFSDPDLVNLDFSLYNIKITLFFVDEFLEERTITKDAIVELGFYDNC